MVNFEPSCCLRRNADLIRVASRGARIECGFFRATSSVLEGVGVPPRGRGLSHADRVARSPSLVLAYTAGTAAVAAERWDLVLRLLTELSVEDSTGSRRGRLLTILNPGSCGSCTRIGTNGSSSVAGIIHRHLGLGVGFAVDAWERFESWLCSNPPLWTAIPDWHGHRGCKEKGAEGLGPTTHRAVLPSGWTVFADCHPAVPICPRLVRRRSGNDPTVQL